MSSNILMTQATAIIVGASSLLSREIARRLADEGTKLALLAQDPDSLKEFAATLATEAQVFGWT